MSPSNGRSARRTAPVGLDVEAMEGRALLSGATAAATVAINNATSAEIATLKGNITTIETATTAFIASANADIKYRQSDTAAHKADAATNQRDIAYDRALIKDAGRDEQFAIGQQLGIIKSLEHSQGVYDKMKTPNTVALQGDIVGAQVKATQDLNGLLGTLAAKKP